MVDEKYLSGLAKLERRRRRRRKLILKRIICFLLLLAVAAGAVFGGIKIYNSLKEPPVAKLEKVRAIEIPDWIDEQIIHLHNTARTGTELDGVKNIVIHYVGNPNTTAKNNRDYFDKDSTEVSSHFVVGLEGEIIQCLPLWEKSAASNWRNNDTISIEVCHSDETGKFNDDTYNAVIKLVSWLLNELGLDESAVIRHYDITEKLCPLYYVEHEDAWEQLKKDVGTKLYEYSK